MRITESHLRQIIRETLLEEQYRIDESSHRIEQLKSSLKAAAISAGITLTSSQLVDMASNMIKAPASQELPYESSHTYTSPISDKALKITAGEKLKGEKLINFVINHHKNISNEDLNDVAIALGEYDRPGHPTAGSNKRHLHDRAVSIISNKLKDSSESQNAQMYGVGRKSR